MRSDLFEHELSKTAGVFGRSSGVEVVFHGDQAMTDGSTVVLPVMTSGAEVDATTMMVLRGYTDHEAGHVRHTDFEALKRFKRECAAAGNTLAPQLHNALEDIWLERRVLRDYPGALKNLRETVRAVDSTFLEQVGKLEGDERLSDPKWIGPVAITWEGRRGYGVETTEKCLAVVPEELREKLPLWVAALDACETTQDVIDLAKVVDWEIAEGPEPEPEPGREEETERGRGRGAGEGEGEPDGERCSGEGQEGEGEGEGEGVEVEVEGDGGTTTGGGDGEAENGEGGVAEEATDESMAGGGRGARGMRRPETVEAVFDGFDMKRVVEKAMKEAGLLKGGTTSYRPWSRRYDKWHHRSDAENKYGHYTYGQVMARAQGDAYDQLKARHLTGQINVMRRKLERAIVSKQKRDWQGGYEAGRLDTRALVRAVRGDANVFKMREDDKDIDTAISILVDMSGSMSDGSGSRTRAWVAQLVAMALAEALDRTGARYEILGFNARSGPWDRATGVMGSLPVAYEGRYEPIDMYEFKRFDETLYQARGALTCIEKFVGGNNVDGESVLYAYHRLAARSERRKVLLTLSDGEPAFYTKSHSLGYCAQHLRDVIDFILKRGVECVGIGIESTAVKKFYPRWAVVNRLEDLAGTTIEVLARLLVDERYVADNSKLMSVGGMMR
jgi:cobalamin biosynthesis protein CobT